MRLSSIYTTLKKNHCSILFALLIFVIPTNLFHVLSENFGYAFGLRIDYLIPKIYLSDIVLIILSSVLYKNNLQKLTVLKIKQLILKHKALSAVGVALLCVQFFTPIPVVSVLQFLRFFLIISSVYMLLKKGKKLLTHTIVLISIAATTLFQSSIAGLQFFLQKSLLGYWFLGETNLSAFAGIAKSSFNGVERVLPYGTTAHPNILAGILVVFVLLLLQQRNRYNSSKQLFSFWVLSITTGVCTIFLTQSLSALVGLILGVVAIYHQKKQANFKKKLITFISGYSYFFILIILTAASVFALSSASNISNNPSILRRATLNSAAFEILQKNTITGVGLSHFSHAVSSYTYTAETIRFVQPAHNTILLFLAETGILGLLFIWQLHKHMQLKIKTSILLLAVIPILLFDHYLLSLQSGMLLMLIICSYSLKK